MELKRFNLGLVGILIAGLSLTACSSDDNEEIASTTESVSEESPDSTGSDETTEDDSTTEETSEAETASYTLNFGAAALHTDLATSNAFLIGYHTFTDVRCDDGSYVTSVEAESDYWSSVLPSITWIKITCMNPADETTTEIEGGISIGASTTVSSSCEASDPSLTENYDGDYLVGFNLIHDTYIKDIRTECGVGAVEVSEDETTATFGIVSRDTYSDFYFGRIDHNDTDQNLRCSNNQVINGFRLHYRYNWSATEAAFTGMRLFCSEVTATVN